MPIGSRVVGSLARSQVTDPPGCTFLVGNVDGGEVTFVIPPLGTATAPFVGAAGKTASFFAVVAGTFTPAVVVVATDGDTVVLVDGVVNPVGPTVELTGSV